MATATEQQRIARHNEQVEARLRQLNAGLDELTRRYRQKVFNRELAHLTDADLRQQVEAALIAEPKQRDPRQQQLVSKWAAAVSVAPADLAVRFEEYRSERGRLLAAVAAENALKKSIVPLRGLIDLEGPPAQAHVLIRGDWNRRGAAVEPGVPRVLTAAGHKFEPPSVPHSSGRRLELARWLVSRRNPLTARVQVNRLWMHHFGEGIVATPANFGMAGARPSHPELLDYLATEFVARGWSIKAMHRLMLHSTAYRQSSQPNRRALAADPENRLLGSFRPRRLQGEVLRDSILAVTGKLNRRMFGTPIPVTRNGEGLVTVDDTAASNRASIYLIVRRSQPVTLLELFDVPSMEVNCPERNESIVVTQSLTLMNSRFTEANARAMAERVLDQGPGERRQRIEFLYELLLARKPSVGERTSVAEFLDSVERQQLEALPDAATDASRGQALLSAWQQLSIVLFNSNAFLYVP
jgi:hypothetical protein